MNCNPGYSRGKAKHPLDPCFPPGESETCTSRFVAHGSGLWPNGFGFKSEIIVNYGNLWALIAPSLEKHGNNPAWICRTRQGNRTFSYGELKLASLTMASRLRSRGIQPSDTVAITAPNGPEWSIAAWAAWKLGASILLPWRLC